MRCSNCGTENPAGKKFCAQCGSRLPALCPSCGGENLESSRFCGDCGAALPGNTPPAPAKSRKAAPTAPDVRVAAEQTNPPSASDGERKTITVLFADIKGSMNQIEDLDPEEARAILDPALAIMAEAVNRYQGHVAQSTGDGIFALFGAPIAHEDHPQRAIYAAMRMQEELRRYCDRLRAEGKAPVEIRIGINTGEIVMRSVGKDQSHAEYLPAGHAVGLASRLQTIAPTGSIAVSDNTRRLVEGYFQLKSLGPTRIKGVTEPVDVHEVLGLGLLRTRLQRSASRGPSRFVGRDADIAQMRRALDQAKSGRGQMVAAMAEPGVGKSRLFFEFKAVAQSGCMVLEAFSISHGKASAYLPVIDLLHGYFEIANADDRRVRRERVTDKVLTLERSLEDALPYLFGLLGIVEGADPLAGMDPQIKRQRTFGAIKRILLRESLSQPLIVIFEDLHWIDGETQALLNLLADSIATAKILLLVNYRPEYRHEWGSKTYYTQLRLDPLGKESADEMLSAILGGGVELAPLKRLIIDKTEGNPFFMEETVQVMFDEGALARNGTVKLTKSLSQLKIPLTVQAILASRIDRLPPDEKDLLLTLAVLGREFPFGLIKSVVAKSEDELNRMLSDLQFAEFIYEQSTIADIEYTFKHALTQEVAYNSLLIARRKLLHERAGQALESMFAERLDDHLGELAHHYRSSGNVSKAVDYLGRAAAQAAQRAAHAQAATHIASALELLKDWPAGAERAKQEITLQLTLGASLQSSIGQGASEAERAYGRAHDLCREVGEAPQLFRVLSGLWAVYQVQAKFQAARELGVQLLALAQSLQYPLFLLGAHEALGTTLLWLGEFAPARAHLEQGIALYDPQKRRSNAFRAVQDPGVDCLSFTALALWYLGYPDQALKRIQEAIALARELAHPYTLAYASCHAAMVHQLSGQVPATQEWAEGAIAICAEHGFPFFLGVGTIIRGWALAAQGQVQEGIAEIREGLALYRTTGSGINFPHFLLYLAEGYADAEQAVEGLRAVDEGLAVLEKTGERWYEADLHRLKGVLTLQSKVLGPRSKVKAEAERHFRKAIEVTRRQSAKSWELRATISLARLLRDTGRRDEARTMLAEIYNWFTEGFDTADLKDAKALLERLNK
jgi:class 3 adenylate cyclase/predicted ATPase